MGIETVLIKNNWKLKARVVDGNVAVPFLFSKDMLCIMYLSRLFIVVSSFLLGILKYMDSYKLMSTVLKK